MTVHRLATVSVAVGALAWIGCGGGSESEQTAPSAGPQPIHRARLVVTLSAPNHHPRVGAAWPITVHATAGGRPVSASVRYQYLFAGAVVAERSHYRFLGTFHDTIRWPERSLGIPLTFRALVRTPLGTRRLDYPVEVRR